MRRVAILSRHPSHSPLRNSLPEFKQRVIVRFGSTTSTQHRFPKLKAGYKVIEINTVEAIKNSASKLLMKQKFNQANVKHAAWGKLSDVDLNSIKDTHFHFSTDEHGVEGLEFPVVVKHYFGSRGSGNYKINNGQELKNFIANKNTSMYLVEDFFEGVREYRFHVAKGIGCFYSCRKMLKSDTPKEKRWYRNDSNSVWILPTNPDYQKPNSYNAIIEDCLKALDSTGLDFAAFDVKVQSAKDKNGDIRKFQEYVLIECNSAPSFGEGTLQRYIDIIPQLISKQLNN